jgi:Protein of unknown function (DUF2393)
MSAESPSPDHNPHTTAANGQTSSLFTQREAAPEPIAWTPWIIAAAVVLAVALLLVITHHSKPPAINTLLEPAPYASSLAISGIQMSESTSLSGGKVTYIDGHIKDNGPSTLTAATVQVVFANDEAMPPQIETLPLTLIRTHEPYVDTQPVFAAPIPPGEDREFRLIFESITPNWNGQIPQIRVIQTTQR